MSAVLETGPIRVMPADQARSIRDRIADWSNVDSVSQAVAELLAGELKRPVVSIYRWDASSGELVLLGVAPPGTGRLPKGSRRTADRTLLDAAVRLRTAQRSLNYYVEPDFVRSLPGETRSALAVPIATGARVLGVLLLEYSTPNTPTSSDEEISEHLAGWLGIAWDAARNVGAGETGAKSGSRRPEGAPAISSLSSALAQAEDFSSVLTRAPQVARDLLQCRAVVLLMRHNSRQMLEVISAAGVELAADVLVPMDGTRVGQVARNGKPAEVTGKGAGDPLVPEGVLPFPVQDAIAVPVSSGGKTLGVLLALESRDAAGFGGVDVELLQACADQAGAADALRAIGPLRQKISDASLIAEVGRAMTGTLGLDDVLALVVRGAEMLVSGKFAAVALLSDDRSSLILAATSGSLQSHHNAIMLARESVVGWVAVGGESLITEQLGTDERGWNLGEGFGPAVLVPLESRGQIRGVLLAGRAPGADVPTDEDKDALRKLGSHAAIAIDNARLYREQTELSRTLKEKTVELEKAYAELHTSQERLLVSEKMAALGRVTAGIAHEINSPLGSILNCLQLSITYGEEYKQSATDPDVKPEDHVGIATDLLESLRLAEEATRRVGQFVRTIKGQTRMEDEKDEVFDPSAEAESTVLMLGHELNDGRIKLIPELERGIELRGDSNKFAVVVQNLVSNAIDAYEGREGEVRIRIRREDSTVVLEVEDRGHGIPMEVRPRIYDYLFTTKDIGQGTGLGLSLTHSIVTSHFHGVIDFRSETGVGTTFIVTLPIEAGI